MWSQIDDDQGLSPKLKAASLAKQKQGDGLDCLKKYILLPSRKQIIGGVMNDNG